MLRLIRVETIFGSPLKKHRNSSSAGLALYIADTERHPWPLATFLYPTKRTLYQEQIQLKLCILFLADTPAPTFFFNRNFLFRHLLCLLEPATSTDPC